MSKVIVALDFAEAKTALDFAKQIQPNQAKLKVGKELFAVGGPDLVSQLVEQGYDVFLDLKYHDIPTTVAKACAAVAKLGVWMVNVHALGGNRMIEAARDALENAEKRPLLTAVTILTSFDEEQLAAIGLQGSIADNVRRLAKLAHTSGADGVVCSAQEAKLLRQDLPSSFELVTPGIRLVSSAQDDQQRIMTPTSAMQAGASYLVIGRPITQAKNPMEVLEQINSSLLGA